MISKEDVRKMPKIDLHRHLDGDITPATMWELGRAAEIKLPADDVKGMDKYFKELTNEGLGALLRKGFGLVTALLQTRENLELAAYEEVRNLADDGIAYAEVRFAPQYHTGESAYYGHTKSAKRLDYTAAIKVVGDGLRRGGSEFGVDTKIIVCIGREADINVGTSVVKAALGSLKQGVVAIDLACDEATFPPERHAFPYSLTFGTQLMRTVHAGEFGSALGKNMKTAITLLGANRLGHARTIAQYEDILALALKGNIGIEMCPDSNIYVGLIKSRKELQVDKLLSRGALVTINSDDPAMFGYTLTETIHRTAGEYGFSIEDLRKLQRNSVSSAFIGKDAKASLLDKVNQ